MVVHRIIVFVAVVTHSRVFANRCQIPYVFFSTSSGTLYHNKLKSNNTPSMVNDNINHALLSFDGMKKRLYLYADDKMFSYKLDGSNRTEFNLPNVEFFAVDGRNQLIYYHHELQDKIYVYDIESGTDDEVAELSTVSGVKDMEVDMRNGHLYIAKTSDPAIVRYDQSTGNVMNLTTGGTGQSITLDQYNDVIYWANYDGSSHRVMRTLFTGQTSDLNISYSNTIILTSDVLHLYVLDTENNRIDKISKESLEVQSNFTYSGDIRDIIMAYDNDECCLGTFCHKSARCADYLGGFNCSCRDGFTGGSTVCEDIDECEEKNDNCLNEIFATCLNIPGSFLCSCNRGFTGDGVTSCRNVDECKEGGHNCSVNAVCIDVIGSFICSCKTGFSGNGAKCQDIDECALGMHKCHDKAKCINNDGSFLCSCKSDYTGNGTHCEVESGSPGQSVSVIIGIVVAFVVLFAIIFFMAYLLWKRKPVASNTDNIEDNENTGYDDVLSQHIELPQIPNSESGYEVPNESPYAQLDNSARVSTDENYQSLIVENQAQSDSNFQQYPTLNIHNDGVSDVPNESEYVIVP